MRRIAWGLLLLFAFAIPWEYSLDLGEPLGNIARMVGLLLLLVAIPAVLQAGRLRTPGPLQWLVLAFYLWFCCTYFWTIEPLTTADQAARLLPGDDDRVAGVGVCRERRRSALAAAGNRGRFMGAGRAYAGQFCHCRGHRQARSGLSPTDRTRTTWRAFSTWDFRWRRCSSNSESRWPWRLLAAGYLPLGLVAVLLTASRGGFLAAIVALVGSGLLLVHGHPRRVLAAALAVPPLAGALWFVIPRGSFERLATISEQLQGGDLNQRLNIWAAGWHAFVRAPFFGTGADTFVSAAGLAPIDTAHNTALAIAVSGGLCALFLASAIVAAAIWSVLQTHGPLRWAHGHGARRLGRYLAGRHGRGEPHHLAAVGHDCAGRTAGQSSNLKSWPPASLPLAKLRQPIRFLRPLLDDVLNGMIRFVEGNFELAVGPRRQHWLMVKEAVDKRSAELLMKDAAGC